MDRILRVAPIGLTVLILSLAALVGLAAALAPSVTNGGDGGGAAQAASPSAASASDASPIPSTGPELIGPSQSVTRLPAPGEPKEMPSVEAAPLAVASPLAAAEPDEERSEQMEQIARQADRQTRHGLELAGRGAYFAARSEFFAALRLIAEGLDAERAGTVAGAGKGDSPQHAQRGTIPFSGHGRASAPRCWQ